MTTAVIEKSALLVQVAGKTYQVVLPQERMDILVRMATGLSDNEKLNLLPADGLAFGAKE